MENKKFSLRPLALKDVDRMLEWMHDDDVTQYLRLDGKSATKESVSKFIADAQHIDQNCHCAIVDENDLYYGTVSLKNIDKAAGEAEYAIALHSSAIGQRVAGIATELILECAFAQLGLRRVYLNVLDENKRAIKFYEKFGFNYIKNEAMDFGGAAKYLRWYDICNNAFPTPT